jgi:hypothetical protein
MVSTEQIKKLNKILEVHGTIPYGDEVGKGIFQFKRATEIKLPHKTGTKTILSPTGLSIVVPCYEMLHQMRPDDDRWVVVKWLNPTEEEWDRKHESVVEWPRHGYYFIFQPLEAGKEPTQDWAEFFVDHIFYQKSLTPQQHLAKVVEQGEAPNKVYEKQVQDIARDHFVNHVPGKRGGVYLAFSESSKPAEGGA